MTEVRIGKLVYCKALVKEVLRWRSVAILGGLPHAPTKDDVYRGYFIPEGTRVIVLLTLNQSQSRPNLWAIH